MLLAKLLLHPNQVVSTEELIVAVWGEEPPPTVKQSLQNHVAALRKEIEAGNGAGPPRTLVTRDPGYLLQVDPERLDLHRFQRLDRAGRGRGAPGRLHRGPDRGRAGPRPAPRAGGRAGGAGPALPAARAPPRPADAGPLPLGPPGRRPGRLPGRPQGPGRRAGDRAQRRPPAPGAGHPGPGPGARPAGAGPS